MSYEDNLKRWKKAYTEVLEVCEKYPNFDNQFGFRDINEMRANAKNHLRLIEWYEKYGLKISHDYKPYTYNHINLNEYLHISFYKDSAEEKEKGSGRFISWSDDGKQPDNEWLLNISFSTGAYIFGEDYDSQKKLFQDFFNELKSYLPDYCDTANKSLYWKLENAKGIYENFYNILKKYKDRNQSELKQRQADKLRKELAKIESEL